VIKSDTSFHLLILPEMLNEVVVAENLAGIMAADNLRLHLRTIRFSVEISAKGWSANDGGGGIGSGTLKRGI